MNVKATPRLPLVTAMLGLPQLCPNKDANEAQFVGRPELAPSVQDRLAGYGDPVRQFDSTSFGEPWPADQNETRTVLELYGK